MKKVGGLAGLGGVSLAALAILLAPADAASNEAQKAKRPRSSTLTSSFTPAVADPRLAAEFAHRGLEPSRFRFTPSAASGEKSKAIRVAVRARTGRSALSPAAREYAETSASPVTAITPSAYNLGVSVGWKRFAVSGDVAKVQGGPVPGTREAAELDLSYSIKKFTGSVQLGTERSDGVARIVPDERSYSVGVGGSYKLTRNLDVTGGLRYKIQNDRLDPLVDERRDSQAVYIGTAFRF